MKELFETVCELEQEKVEKEVKDVKLQIRRAAEFYRTAFRAEQKWCCLKQIWREVQRYGAF